MSRYPILQILIVAALLVAAGVAANVTAPSAAIACSDPPCRAR
jgi:hypothetical protein